MIQKFNTYNENIKTEPVESITVTKDELNKFLEDWDDGLYNIFDADWDIKSIKIAKFLGIYDN